MQQYSCAVERIPAGIQPVFADVKNPAAIAEHPNKNTPFFVRNM
jgi:hypothetical protein